FIAGLKRTRPPFRGPHLKPPLQEVDFYYSAVNVISDFIIKKIKRLFSSEFNLECTLLVVKKGYSGTAAAR
ncbi:hypothetical protein AB6D30_16345, partial [Pectobacterium brasiliense]|uniref:hypothetical protein n=1 Tax=Pectobacterium brasiliense TaxID=180957 RepID=UPI0039861365